MAPTGSRRPGRPPAAKADETRKRIVHAAREVFSEVGYDGATFQAIAVRADLTRPAINHYFRSKLALYREVAEQTTALFVMAGVERARSETTTMGRIAAFITVGLNAENENPSMAAFLMTAVMESQRHPELSEPGADPVEMTREFLSWTVNEAIDLGELPRDTDVPNLTETLLVVLCGAAFYAGFIRSYQELETITVTLQQLLAGGLWRSPD